MNKLFCKLPCQSFSKSYKNKEIYEDLFDKRVDKRYLESAVQRFINLNKRLFAFLGIEVELSGTDNDLSLLFRTSNYIGAIPVKMPYDGIAHKDFQVVPRFDNSKDVYSELTQLLSKLNYSIKPEHSELDMLNSSMQLQPPMFYEALKYIELFEKAYKYGWVKFDSKINIHAYPKSSTDWSKYFATNYDPQKALAFPSRDSVLTTNHTEWEQLKFVFDIAKEQVVNPTVPVSIRLKYSERIRSISSNVSNVNSVLTNEMVKRAGDPNCIKLLKDQANVILQKSSQNCSAWRMDIAMLFERYVQSIVDKATKELAGTVISNAKLYGSGNMPSWGLRYLEPDIMIRMGNNLIMGDAKYKANFYANETKLDSLKETHRTDLHQLLAYCSFEPQKERIGILFYPAKDTYYKRIKYTDRICGSSNTVILCGVAFGMKEMEASIPKIKNIFQNDIIEK